MEILLQQQSAASLFQFTSPVAETEYINITFRIFNVNFILTSEDDFDFPACLDHSID
jgi:hypothetical protein